MSKVKRERPEGWWHKWYLSHQEERLVKQHEQRQSLKQEVLTHYGKGKLACLRCGLDDVRTLSLDHIKGGGNKVREIEGSGVNLYRSLKKQGYPEGFQTLCANCQLIKRFEFHEGVGRRIC